jgi:hypothetical protein
MWMNGETVTTCIKIISCSIVNWLAFVFYASVPHFCAVVRNIFKLTSIIVIICLKAGTSATDDPVYSALHRNVLYNNRIGKNYILSSFIILIL